MTLPMNKALYYNKKPLRIPSDRSTFDGIRCGRGHDGERYVRTGQCVGCVVEFQKYEVADLKRTAADGRTPPVHARALLAAQGGGCAYCGSQKNLRLDHKISVNDGGHNWPKNRQWLCAPHNYAKRCTPDREYRRMKGIPSVTRWDAPTSVVQRLDADARLLGDSVLVKRSRHLMKPAAALDAIILGARRRHSRPHPSIVTRRGRARVTAPLPDIFLWALVA